MTKTAAGARDQPLSLDALVLVVLVLARVRIDTLADLVAPRPEETVRSLPLIGGLLSDTAWSLMRNWLTDPVSLLLITLTFFLLGLYILADCVRQRLGEVAAFRLKLGLIFAIIGATVVAQSLFLILMRHATGPAAFTHDGGVIQTEEAIKLLASGRNPYREDYLDTPLAQWGLEKRTALYHYPYLPWTFLASMPVKELCDWLLGWYDQRFLYLFLFVLTLAALPGLVRRGQGTEAKQEALLLTMMVGLNPIMGSDIIFGMNDSFVLAWIVGGLWLLRRQHHLAASLVLGLAWASKPTSWFLAPFYVLFLAGGARAAGSRGLRNMARVVWQRLWPAVIVFALLVLPFAAWDWAAFVDDVWAWSAGTSSTPYQIRGWGLSNLVLALGLVPDQQAYFPFWVGELLVCLPLLIVCVRWQSRSNNMRRMLLAFAALFGTYSYLSRFFNENYAGFLLALFSLAALVDDSPCSLVPIRRDALQAEVDEASPEPFGA